MNAVDMIMGTGYTVPAHFYKYKAFPNRKEAHRIQNELIERYREEADEQAYLELLEMMIPVIFSTMQKFKFTDHLEFRLVCIEIFTRCLAEYEISDDTSKMLFSGFLQMNLRFGALDHLNHYVEDRNSFWSLDAYHERGQEPPIQPFEEEDSITDFKMYLALDKLTKRERQVMTMYYFENKGEAEIIKELGIKESSFPVYLSKSKKAFREAYTEVLELDLLQLPDEEMEL